MASLRQSSRATASPSTPVPALALPELINSPRIRALARFSRAIVTGAAQYRLLVNTPATLAPSHIDNTSKSRAPLDLIPLAAVASWIPEIESSLPGGVSPTAIVVPTGVQEVVAQGAADCTAATLRCCSQVSGLRYFSAPWHLLNFLPEPHQQGSLRPTFG